jgi:CHAT domain-containing protein
MRQGRYAEAEVALIRALAVVERSAGPNHPRAARSLGFASELCRLEDNSNDALDLAARASGIMRNSFVANARVMSERNALTYSRAYKRSIDAYLTCYSEIEVPDSLTRMQAADLIVSSKGQVSDGISQRQKSLVGETDSTSLALAEDLRIARFKLAELFVQGPDKDAESYRNELDSLSHLANELEETLSRHSASFRRHQEHEHVSTNRIASLLPENSVLVEYVRYDYRQLEPRMEIPHYMVVVLVPDGEPVITDLGEAEGIDALIDEYRSHMLQVASAVRMPTAVERDVYGKISEDLYEKTWQPIEDHVRGRDLLLIAPDGALNMISFAGLWGGEGRYLIEESAVHYLSGGRDVIGLADQIEAGSGLFALGDPDYDASVTTRLALAAADEEIDVELAGYATRNVRSSCGQLTDITVEALPGTKDEIDLIVSGWRRLTDEPVAVHLGPDATEDRFKAESAGRRVIHLATHGYFFESRCQPENAGTGFELDEIFVGENPLLLSGLLLAGANLHGEGADSLWAEDGILTAYEVSAMDLDGTELVVLSACETGLGKVEHGEGVYGLRRAFQMAGTRTVVSALWPVSDTATAEIMSGLYERADKSLPDTMRRTQLGKINQLRRSNQPDHPFTWAGFIALGAWD